MTRKHLRVQFNLALEDAEAVLDILKHHGSAYTRSHRHSNYDNEITVLKLRRLIHPKNLLRHNVFISKTNKESKVSTNQKEQL